MIKATVQSDRRSALRIPMEFTVTISRGKGMYVQALTADVSAKGLFVKMPAHEAKRFSKEEMVKVRITGSPVSMPIVDGRVKRITNDGIGLEVDNLGFKGE